MLKTFLQYYALYASSRNEVALADMKYASYSFVLTYSESCILRTISYTYKQFPRYAGSKVGIENENTRYMNFKLAQACLFLQVYIYCMQYAYHFLNLFAYKFLFETILYIPANFYSVHIFLLDNDILPVLNIQ